MGTILPGTHLTSGLSLEQEHYMLNPRKVLLSKIKNRAHGDWRCEQITGPMGTGGVNRSQDPWGLEV
jgi:hypothetical protein